MNRFNKLYNLILQSIISQDIQSKIKKAIQTLIKSGQLKSEDDPRVEQVKAIIKRNSSIDINGKTKLDQLLKQNQKYLNRVQNKKNSKNIIKYIDNNIKEFSQKKEYDNGVVIYLVQDSKAGQEAVRKVIDICLGEDKNPWCLASRGGEGLDANYDEFYIDTYNAYPKHIAFQNGQLIGFCASGDLNNIEWWDLQNNSTPQLKLLDGSYMQTYKYAWTSDKTLANFLKKYPNLVYNQQTKCYDCEFNVNIQNQDLINGHLPIKFGVVKGNFDYTFCKNLTSLQGAPVKVQGNFDCFWCFNLTSLKGAPEQIGGNFKCGKCSLKSLEGAPKKVGGDFICGDCKNLQSLQGAPKYVRGNFSCQGCINLKSLEGCPERVGGRFDCCSCHALTSLQYGPKEVGGDYECEQCKELTTLQGAPKYVGGKFDIRYCDKLEITDEDRKKYKIVE